MTLPVVFTANGPSGYNLTKSLRFRSSASAYLNRTPASAGTSNTKMTFSAWVKRGTLGAGLQGLITGSTTDGIQFWNDNIDVYFNGGTYRITSPSVYRDPAAWYHIVVAIDTTQATAANRVFIYVNNVLVTSTTGTPPPQNYTFNMNQAISQRLARDGGTAYFDGYMAEVNDIDGQQLTPSSFGSTNSLTGVWQPAKYTGTYGTNGFYLPFTNTTSTTTLGYDFSGNSNNWTTNNLSLTAGTTYDSMTDVPTLTSATTANYCVLNPLDKGTSGTVSNGNLNWAYSSGAWSGIRSTFIIPKTGKWYWEVTVLGTYCDIGIYTSASNLNSSGYNDAYCYSYGSGNAAYRYGGVDQATVATYTTNDVISYYVNAGEVKVYKNNSLIGTWSQNLSAYSGDYFAGVFANSNANGVAANFGQQPFVYTPPTGAVALNTYNLPTSTIVKGNTVMDATLYTGTLLSNAVTNTAGFKPDLVWIKSRSAATDNKLTDSVRGTTKALISNTNGSETTDTQGLTAFGSNGFTVGTNTDYNNITATYVGWQWQAGQGSTSSNTSGSITSTVSVNATAGFSVVTYTGNGSAGASIGHGLGVTPSMVMFKDRSSAVAWIVYHTSLGSNTYLTLNNTTAGATATGFCTPSSSTITFTNTYGNTNTNGDTYVAYCWSEIAGFSKFGSYTGNGSSDGPFVYTGFRPKYVMAKVSSTTGPWNIFDSVRGTYNVNTPDLWANSSNAETANNIDFLSNGFKVRDGGGDLNGSGATYIYMAFAENPFKNALAR